jgi:hypothetical protein
VAVSLTPFGAKAQKCITTKTFKNNSMNNSLLKTIESAAVQKVTRKIATNADRLTGLWFDAGLEYLQILKTRIRRKRVFDAQFRPMIHRNSDFGKLQPEQVFEQIKKSDAFWQWWTTQLWCICTENEPGSITELAYLLEFNEQLIPQFILKKIFYGEQKHHSGSATGLPPAAKTGSAAKKANQAAKRVESRV